ncbi:MAG: hypothetical protein RDV48_24610 [Candidatus Eremiobacteraeota bacterium]|nr:hypothetical protein [Candidatus Eremiobacteraeota bacterium]
MKNRVILAGALVILVLAAVAAASYAGEFQSPRHGISVSWPDTLKRSPADEKGATLVYLESPGQKSAVLVFRIDVIGKMSEEVVFSQELHDRILSSLQPFGPERFIIDKRTEVGGLPARRLQYKGTTAGKNFWGESIIVAGSGTAFMIQCFGDFDRKSEFVDALQQILANVSIAGAAPGKPSPVETSPVKPLTGKPSPTPGGFGDDF